MPACAGVGAVRLCVRAWMGTRVEATVLMESARLGCVCVCVRRAIALCVRRGRLADSTTTGRRHERARWAHTCFYCFFFGALCVCDCVSCTLSMQNMRHMHVCCCVLPISSDWLRGGRADEVFCIWIVVERTSERRAMTNASM